MKGTWLAVTGAVLILGVIPGCARKAPPPGGPEDLTPPEVVRAFPDSGQANVGTDTRLEIEFSENMDKRSVEDWIFVRPRPGRLSFSWKGRTLRIGMPGGLTENATYNLLLARNAKDRHGNKLARPFGLLFSTSEVPAGGRISGRLKEYRVPAADNLVLAWSSTWSDTVLSDPENAQYLGYTESGGEFTLAGLDENSSYILAAFYDRNHNRVFDRSQDFVSVFPETIVLTPERPEVSGIEWWFADAATSGTLAGEFSDSLWSGSAVSVVLRNAADSTLSYCFTLAEPDSFVLPGVLPGTYDLSVFEDPDSDCAFDPRGGGERFRWGSMKVGPKEIVGGLKLGLWTPFEEAPQETTLAPADTARGAKQDGDR